MTSLTRNYSPLIEPTIHASIYPFGLYNPNILVPTINVKQRDYISPIALATNRIGSSNSLYQDDIGIKSKLVGSITSVGINPIYTPFPYSYPDLNNDNQVQKKFTLYFWYKLKRHWIKKYMKKLSKYVNSDNYNYVLNGIYTKQSLAESLDKFRIRMNIDWWDLKLYKHTLKKFIYYQIKKKVKRALA